MIYYDYYKDTGVRMTAHNIKDCDTHTNEYKEALRIMSEYFIKSDIVNKDAILIPAPQHTGSAEYTLDIASAVSSETGLEVADIIKCKPHSSLYYQRVSGKPCNVEFYLEGELLPAKYYLLVDNVISTGYTYKTIGELLKVNILPLVYAIDYSSFNQFVYLEKMVKAINGLEYSYTSRIDIRKADN